ncbi:DEAD/DEAH box helicase [Nocardia sp. NPDC004573]
MTEWDIQELIHETGAADASQAAQVAFLLSRIGTVDRPASYEGDYDLELLGQTLEGFAAQASGSGKAAEIWRQAFLCRRVAAQHDTSNRLYQLVRLAADGILAQRRPEVMLALKGIGIPPRESLIYPDTSLDDILEFDVLRAFLLLARRNGWEDLNESRDSIMQLRRHHQNYQDQYLLEQGNKAAAGIRLIARFNLAKIVEIAASFTMNGQPVDPDIQLDKHERNLKDLFKLLPDGQFEELSHLVVRACREIISSSIWKDTQRLGQDFRRFVAALASPGRRNPTLELWPSQRRALDSNLLDPAKRAIVVEMPTSAGKTLLAEFCIVQAHALNPDSTVSYIVPTRALVNQITQRLRRDFRPLNLTVEAAAPVFEIDPTEDRLLRDRIDVLVCTPEKLDLLIKSGHAAVRNLSLAVVDEAHNLGDGDRGVRMELLLGTLKRERPEIRFLMLTPFVPNADELGRWLGDGAEATIAVNWRPSERVVTSTEWTKIRRGPRVLSLSTLDSADNVDVPAGYTAELLRLPSDFAAPGKTETSALAAVELAKNGSVLVLARGRGTAEVRAREIADRREEFPLSPLAQAVANYISIEGGADHPLVRQLGRKVTYHHAGVSHDLRYLLELLIERGDVDIVCGTTTLAQGLNFPISSVILETLTKPQGIGQGAKDLSYSEFWNIAGRAGRALQDSVGLVVFPTLSKVDREKVQQFLREQAADVCSHLLQAASQLSSGIDHFDLKFVRENSALAVFLQYLAHVARVAGAEETSRDIEELLRSSLVYHQTRESDRRLAEQLISLSRTFMSRLEGVERGYLALADNTGFSLPSVDYAFAASHDHPEFRSQTFWDARNLFGEDISGLTSVIEVIAGIPELNLGVRNDEPNAVFNARTVAGITRDWVNGESLSVIADRWFGFEPHNTKAKRLSAAGHYVHSRLVGQVPWGMSALYTLVSSRSGEQAASPAYAGAMVFYGVPSPEAVTMRIGGVPRPAAAGLGTQWSGDDTSGATFRDLRKWIAGRSARQWASALPPRSKLTGEQCRLLWRALVDWTD